MSGSVSAQTGADSATVSAVRQVITTQLRAFRQDDGKTAFGQAAPSIRAKFQSIARFMLMVRKLYPPVYRNRAVRFGRLRVIRGAPIQEVHLVGEDAQLYLALYQMQRQKSGIWKIVGVVLLKSQGRSL